MLNKLGGLSLASDTFADARIRYEQALSIATEVTSKPEEAHAIEGMAQCDFHDGKPDTAVAQLRVALRICYIRSARPSQSEIEMILRERGCE